jgi:hypothetical protein
VIAEIAFIGDPRYRMEIADPVGAGLDTVPAADTAFGVYQNDTVVGSECGADRADLDAGGVIALVAELWDKKTSQYILFHDAIVRLIKPRTDGVDRHAPVYLDHIFLHPGAEVKGGGGYVVFRFTCLHTPAAADAFVDIDPHPVVVFCGIVGLVQYFCPGIRGQPAQDSAGRNNPTKVFQEVSPIH